MQKEENKETSRKGYPLTTVFFAIAIMIFTVSYLSSVHKERKAQEVKDWQEKGCWVYSGICKDAKGKEAMCFLPSDYQKPFTKDGKVYTPSSVCTAKSP